MKMQTSLFYFILQIITNKFLKKKKKILTIKMLKTYSNKENIDNT